MTPSDPQFLTLSGDNSSVIFEVREDGAPICRYWGAKLPNGTVPPQGLQDERGVPTFSLDSNIAATIFPTFGAGFYGAPALLAHRNSVDFAHAFNRCGWLWLEEGRSVRFSLDDDIAQLSQIITITLDPDNDVLTFEAQLANLGRSNVTLNWLAAACMPLPADCTTVRSYVGRHNHEFELNCDRLSGATWMRENRRGLTSHDCSPAAVVTSDATNEHVGRAYAMLLTSSSNHSQRIDRQDDGSFQWQMGSWLAPGEVVLEAGGSWTSPQVLATYSNNGLNGIAQNFHHSLRKRVPWHNGQMKPRPVHFNTWEGVYFDLSEAALMAMAGEAAKLGVERFILDDGWFHARRNDKAGLGDWWVDPKVFPNGLLPLAQHVESLGMEFGLWVEPEMVNPDSDLYLAHPDWALQLEGRPQLTARNQLVLDLSRPEVRAYLKDKIGALLDGLPISYLKWDHNRDLTLAGSLGRPAYHAQMGGIHNLLAYINENWPHIEIEACAGGGGRIDAGILGFTHRFWTSDCIDAISRVDIQRGFLQFFPPELMGSHIGASPSHATGRQQALDMRAVVAFGGHFGIELDPRHISDRHKEKIAFWVAAYKAHRHLLHQSQVWVGQADKQTIWQAQGQAHEFVLSIYKTAPNGRRFAPKLTMPFVDQDAHYKVSLIGPKDRFGESEPRLFQEIGAGTHFVSGAWLANSGLQLPMLRGEDGLVLHFVAQQK